MKVLITGGAGYIGSVACHQLVGAGFDVVVVDNLSQGHLSAVPASAVVHDIDIRDGATLASVLSAARPDAVMHFAALTIAPASVGDPAPYWRTNVDGTLNLLDAMRESGTAALVFSSTAAVYGVPTTSPITEDACLAPINPYGASKLAAERAIESYGRAYGLSTAILRYFNVAGADGPIGEDHRPETHLVPSAIEAALGQRGPLAIFGTDFPTRDGSAVRDYVHVADLVDAHVRALGIVMSGQTLSPLNLGTSAGASVLEVVAVTERVTGLPVPVELADRRPGDPPSLVADASQARELLGWEPLRSNLDEMITSAWTWRKAHPSGYGN